MRFCVRDGAWTSGKLHHPPMSLPSLEPHGWVREEEKAAEAAVKPWSHLPVKTWGLVWLYQSPFPLLLEPLQKAELHFSFPLCKIPESPVSPEVWSQSSNVTKLSCTLETVHIAPCVQTCAASQDFPLRGSLLLSQFSVFYWWCHHFLPLVY